MNSEDGKNDGEHEIDHIYEKIAGNFEIPDLLKCPANLSILTILTTRHFCLGSIC